MHMPPLLIRIQQYLHIFYRNTHTCLKIDVSKLTNSQIQTHKYIPKKKCPNSQIQLSSAVQVDFTRSGLHPTHFTRRTSPEVDFTHSHFTHSHFTRRTSPEVDFTRHTSPAMHFTRSGLHPLGLHPLALHPRWAYMVYSICYMLYMVCYIWYVICTVCYTLCAICCMLCAIC